MFRYYWLLSGKLTYRPTEHGPVDIDDLPSKNGDFPQLRKRLPQSVPFWMTRSRFLFCWWFGTCFSI